MQQGGQYGGGVDPSPSLPPNYSNLYGSNTPTYMSTPPSAPSAPSYQPNPSSSSLAPYNSHISPAGYDSCFAQPPASNTNSYSSHSPLPDPPFSSGHPNNSYASSYPSPSYPLVPTGYDGNYGSTPSSDAPASNHFSQYGNVSYGVPSQISATNEAYDQGKTFLSQGEDRRYDCGGGVYLQGSEYERESYIRSDQGQQYGYGGGSRGNYENGGFLDVYAYDGGQSEPYGDRGTGGTHWASTIPGNLGVFTVGGNTTDRSNLTRAKDVVDSDKGVQKFRVKLLPETNSSGPAKDVVCQIGLDGVRMVDPTTNKTLRIYPLETITKWEVKEPSVFTFWAKSAVDVDQRVIQLQSSTYITTSILDTLTAACVQLCEMVGKDGAGDSVSGGPTVTSDSNVSRRSSFVDWMALRPRAASAEEKQHWVPDEAVTKCSNCETDFGAFLRRHHCRNCGDIFCDKCTRGRIALNPDEAAQPVRVCDRCLAEVTQRLDNMKSASNKLATQRTHEDLAKKLQEELERNAVRKPKISRTRNEVGSSGQTSVLNCGKCGTITLVMGGSGCPACGADSGANRNQQVTDREEAGFSSTSSLQGPPHLWPSNIPSPEGTGQQMREVACPTCTVHLQVQVPKFGTEKVECGVCQHPFLVTAN